MNTPIDVSRHFVDGCDPCMRAQEDDTTYLDRCKFCNQLVTTYWWIHDQQAHPANGNECEVCFYKAVCDACAIVVDSSGAILCPTCRDERHGRKVAPGGRT
jgi:hypothetical protein